jgi:hypothetical protein
MPLFDRFKTVVVTYALVALVITIVDAFVTVNLIGLWFESWTFKISILVILWLLAPWVWAKLDGRRSKT